MEAFEYRPGETTEDVLNEFKVKYFIDVINENIAAGTSGSPARTLGQELADSLRADGYACSADTKFEFD